MSKVFVVATHERCPAVSALRSEIIPFELVLVKDEFTYGKTLYQLWESGESFVNIEHDIVPWPGAIQLMLDTSFPWSIYKYPTGHSGKLGQGLGLVYFSGSLIQKYPDANFGWDKTEWNHLDAQVFGALQLDRRILPHIHQPPVAHLTDMKNTLVSEGMLGYIEDKQMRASR